MWVHNGREETGRKCYILRSCAQTSFPPGFSLTWHRIGVKRATSALARGSRKTGGCPVRYRRFYTRLVSRDAWTGSCYRGGCWRRAHRMFDRYSILRCSIHYISRKNAQTVNTNWYSISHVAKLEGSSIVLYYLKLLYNYKNYHTNIKIIEPRITTVSRKIIS